MRERREAPTTWPTPETWARVWAEGLAELERVRVEADGSLRLPEGQDVPGTVRLVAGEHLRSGARYAYDDEVSHGELAIDGPTREVAFTLRPRAGGDRVLEVRLDGLDGFVHGHALFEAPKVRVEGTARHDPARFVEVEGRLPWITGTQAYVVDRAGSGDVLRVDTEVSSRGGWSPVVGSVLALVGSLMRDGLDSYVGEVAGGIASIGETRPPAAASQPAAPAAPPPDPDEMQRAGLTGFAILEQRLREVVSALEAKPWWRGREACARRVLRRTPPTWPAADVLGPYATWPSLERRLLADLLRTDARQRDAHLRTLLATEREHADRRVRAALAVEAPFHPMTVDTAWLGSPLGVLGWMRRQTRAA